MGRRASTAFKRSSSRCLFSPFLFFTRASSASPMINSPGCKRNLRHTDAVSPRARLRGFERNASNDEASVTYAVPTASAADAGFSVPEPTSVGGGGTVLLGVSANRMDTGLRKANGAGDWCIAFRRCHLGDAEGRSSFRVNETQISRFF